MSAPDLVLAIDAGSGSVRAVLYDRAGEEVGAGQSTWTHPPDPGVPGGRRFDTAVNWQLVCGCIAGALRTAGVGVEGVRAISTTSMRGGLVLSDAAGRELWACPNSDARAVAQAERMVSDGAAAAMQTRGGDWVGMTAPARLVWLAEEAPAVLAATARVGLVNDWLLARLSGVHATDPSTASSSGMFDLATRTWAPETLDLAGIDPAWMPDVVDVGTVAGGLTAVAARETGLRAGTPVVVGGADTPLGLVGMGVTGVGECALVGGTFWQQSLALGHPAHDPSGRLRTLCHALPDQWLVEGIGFWSGLVLRWFRDTFCAPEVERAHREGGNAYALLEELAAAIPAGSNGLFALFSGPMDARRWSHGPATFTGFDVEAPERTGRGACVRAIQEAAAFVAAEHVARLEAIAGRPFGEVLFGGGASGGLLWPQIVADVLGREIAIPRRTEATAYGAALAAGVGIGWHTDLAEAGAAARAIVRRVAPDAAAHEIYAELGARWASVYERQRAVAGPGLVEPLWHAPGA